MREGRIKKGDTARRGDTRSKESGRLTHWQLLVILQLERFGEGFHCLILPNATVT
jgi:hypothetical protein